jgi:putative membrane protein
MKSAIFAGVIVTLAATAGYAQAPAPAEFVEKAGASDMFEIDSAKLMTSSKNPAIAKFASQMITDHTKSTNMVKAAAKADGLPPKAPSLTVKQRADLTALKAVPAGKTKDDLYVKQQKAAHAEALTLMKTYAASGTATHLKATAAKVRPVVAMHGSMVAKM